MIMKMSESGTEIGCVVDHEGFEAVCLNLWVLQTAYFMYKGTTRVSNLTGTSLHSSCDYANLFL